MQKKRKEGLKARFDKLDGDICHNFLDNVTVIVDICNYISIIKKS